MEVAQFLIEQGADVQARDKTGNTILHTAVQMVHPEVAELLIQSGADVNVPESIWKRTPLHFVSQLGPPEVAAALIQKGANINARDSLGDTPLHYASLSNRLQIAHILLKQGADPDIPAQDPFTRTPGVTPVMLAKEKAMQDLFKQFGVTR